MSETALDRRTTSDDDSLWLSPRRLRNYQWAKVVGALLMGSIFAGWLIIQGSNPAMRWLAVGLLAVTALVVFASIRDDLLRSRGRQVRIEPEGMALSTPEGQWHIRFADVAYAEWREDAFETAGLWLYDQGRRQLAHLDLNLLGDQDEARAFLHWARARSNLNFEVRWPPAA